MPSTNTPEGYIALDSIDSTNDELRRRLEDGRADEGSILTAATQTKGRGRGQKTWISPRGNLYFSFVHRPISDPSLWSQNSLLLSLIMLSTVDHFVDDWDSVCVKWPNDVLIDGRKVCGALVDVVERKNDDGSTTPFFINGFGMNVNSHPPDDQVHFPATSLMQQCNLPDISVSSLLARLVSEHDIWWQFAERSGYEEMARIVNERLYGIGEEIVIRTQDGDIRGECLGVNTMGFLRLKPPGEDEITLLAGDQLPFVVT